MNFILKNGMTGKNNYKPSLRDINKAIDSLDPEALNPFVILEPSEEINGSKFIQVLCYYDSDIKTGSYRIEIQISDGDSFKQYKYFTPVKSEIKKYFEDYFINALSPDITHWTDFTAEVLNEKSMRDIFNVYDLAETHSRKDKKIFGGYNLYHSGIIKGETEDAVVFQSMAEALILLSELLNSAYSVGDIRYSEDRKKVFFEIKIPDNWKTIIQDVSGFKGFIAKDTILVACYDHEDIFIPHNISPLENLNRLLPCFILIFLIKMFNDENFFNLGINYFIEPDVIKFKKLYTAFSSEIKFQTYFIMYEDASNYNISEYIPFLPEYAIIKDNYMQINRIPV